MTIQLIPILKDNYAYLITGKNDEVMIIDPGEAAPISEALEKQNLRLTHILNTHHHWDHTDGNLELKEKYGCKIIGPEKDRARIPGIDEGLNEGDVFTWQDCNFEVIETPGHTLGHICFYEPELKTLFSGDTLFSMGCGRLFEGTAEQMWNSFEKILKLPDETLIYCGHEYTLGNAKFCLEIEPENADLQKRYAEARELRRAGQPTLPVSLETEKKTNVFLRAGSMNKFREIREIKDSA